MTILSIQQTNGNEIHRLNFFFHDVDKHCFVVYHNCPRKSQASSQIRNAETKDEFLEFVELIINDSDDMDKATANWNHLKSEILNTSADKIVVADGVLS